MSLSDVVNGNIHGLVVFPLRVRGKGRSNDNIRSGMKGMRFFVADRPIDERLLKLDYQNSRAMIEAPDFNVHHLDPLLKRIAPKLNPTRLYREHFFENKNAVYDDVIWEFREPVLAALVSLTPAQARLLGIRWFKSDLDEHVRNHQKGSFLRRLARIAAHEHQILFLFTNVAA